MNNIETIKSIAGKYQAQNKWAKIGNEQDRKLLTEVYHSLHGSHHLRSHAIIVEFKIEKTADYNYLLVRPEKLEGVSDEIHFAFFTYCKTF